MPEYNIVQKDGEISSIFDLAEILYASKSHIHYFTLLLFVFL